MSYIALLLLFCIYYIFILFYMHRKVSFLAILIDGICFFLFHEVLFFLMIGKFFYPFSFSHFLFLFIHTFLYYFVKEIWFYRKKIYKKMSGFTLLVFVFCFCISYIGEFTFCNYKHYATLMNKEREVPFVYHGLKKQGRNEYLITQNKGVYIECKDVDTPLSSAYLAFAPKYSKIPITVTTYVKDEANALYYSLGEKETLFSISSSQYFMYHIAGRAKDIKFVLNDNLKGTVVILKPIVLNPKIPFSIHFYRVVLLSVVLFLLYLIRPSSSFYHYKALACFRFKKIILTFIFSLAFFFTIFFTNINTGFQYIDNDTKTQYYALTEAILDGKFYLPISPSQKLKSLKNPYDTNYRSQYLKRYEDYYWDTAYYKGKYYVYFGITPVLVLFLPYYVLFQTHLSISTSILIFCFLSILGIFYFLYQLIRRWFSKTSFLTYLLLSFLFVSSCGLFYIVKRPTFYHIPISCGFMFMIWGLGLWISSTVSFKNRKLKLFLGSLFMALVAGSRPPFLVSYAFAPLIFYQDIFKKRVLFSKKSMKETICFLLPIVVFAVFMMYYNYVRFSSIFDFGANYNLTTNDMTKRGFIFSRIPSGIFAYLFQPTTIYPIFPYIFMNYLHTNYLGKVIAEPFFGGFIYNHVIFLIPFFLHKFKSYFQEKETYYMAITSLLLTFIVIIFDIQCAGLLPRYISDFGYLFNTALCLLVLAIDHKRFDKKRKAFFRKIFLILIMCSFLYEFLFLFTDISVSLQKWNPEVFYKVSYFIQFWV